MMVSFFAPGVKRVMFIGLVLLATVGTSWKSAGIDAWNASVIPMRKESANQRMKPEEAIIAVRHKLRDEKGDYGYHVLPSPAISLEQDALLSRFRPQYEDAAVLTPDVYEVLGGQTVVVYQMNTGAVNGIYEVVRTAKGILVDDDLRDRGDLTLKEVVKLHDTTTKFLEKWYRDRDLLGALELVYPRDLSVARENISVARELKLSPFYLETPVLARPHVNRELVMRSIAAPVGIISASFFLAFGSQSFYEDPQRRLDASDEQINRLIDKWAQKNGVTINDDSIYGQMATDESDESVAVWLSTLERLNEYLLGWVTEHSDVEAYRVNSTLAIHILGYSKSLTKHGKRVFHVSFSPIFVADFIDEGGDMKLVALASSV